ncbi:hypothetical protein SSTG_05587 [Streptomyces sp. e14]|nr:hypothetical protein SSTG_05587 [Streptomyces sp. e14]
MSRRNGKPRMPHDLLLPSPPCPRREPLDQIAEAAAEDRVPPDAASEDGVMEHDDCPSDAAGEDDDCAPDAVAPAEEPGAATVYGPAEAAAPTGAVASVWSDIFSTAHLRLSEARAAAAAPARPTPPVRDA